MFDYNRWDDVCMVTMMKKDVCDCTRCTMRREREKEEKEKRKKALKEYSSYDYDEESGPARSWSYEHEGLTVPWRGTEE